jgi:hypothetical protein
MPDSAQVKKPLVPKNTKKLAALFGLLLGIPVVLAGTLLPQNIRQDASETEKKQPNVIVVFASSHPYQAPSEVSDIIEKLGGTGIGFTNAFALDDLQESFVAFSDSLQKNGYQTTGLTVIASQSPLDVAPEAETFISQAEQPFYLSITVDTDPIARMGREDCPMKQFSQSSGFNEADVSDKPRYIRALPVRSDAEAKTVLAEESAQVCKLRDIEKLLETLAVNLGAEREETIIVYAGERGYSWGEHRFVGNDCLYDACTRVPVYMSYPALLKSRVSSSSLVTTDDLLPTLAELTGVESSVPSGTRSLVPLFFLPDRELHPSIVMELTTEETNRNGTTYAVRTKEFLYTELPSREKELYDLAADPVQLENQASNPEYTDMIRDFITELQGYREE